MSVTNAASRRLTVNWSYGCFGMINEGALEKHRGSLSLRITRIRRSRRIRAIRFRRDVYPSFLRRPRKTFGASVDPSARGARFSQSGDTPRLFEASRFL